jgi:hypothetical protein
LKSASVHARIRARQRYGIRLGIKDFEQIRILITQEKVKLLEDQVLNKIYLVNYRDEEFRVVYNVIKRKVITVLPRIGSKEWKKFETKKGRNPFWKNLGPEIPLDTDYCPHMKALNDK